MFILRIAVVLAAILHVGVVSSLFAVETTYTFYPLGDSYIQETKPDENEGTSTNLRIQALPKVSHVLLQFSQADLLSTLGSTQVVSATLELYIETNFGNWGSGAMVDVHRISTDWVEYVPPGGGPAEGVTFSCQNDLLVANNSADCEDLWMGGYFEDYISDSLLYQNSETGWKSYNVTSDVQLLINGDETHYGWLIRKRDSAANGSVDYTSIQGTASKKPRLVVVTNESLAACSSTSIASVGPAIVPSDGTSQQVTVTGQGLDRITLIKIDNAAISFTLVNSTMITFTVTYSTTGTHEVWFRSNCLAEPMTNYFLVADSAIYGLEAPMACAATTESFFSRNGATLCWNGSSARLVGYSGDFSLVSWNIKWSSGNASTIITDFMNAGQYKAATGSPVNPNTSRGFNIVRLGAMGGSCNVAKGPENCIGYANEPERMPFCCDPTCESTCNSLDSDYYLTGLTGNGSKLDPTWKARLKNFIDYADQNGIAVMIHLFDENNISLNVEWGKNPWNPLNNDFICGELSGDPFPAFFDICPGQTNSGGCNKNGNLNCLGKLQRAYVKSVVSTVKNTLKCGDGNDRCRNVIFEVMNEARFDKDWGLTKDQFKLWHDTVAKWVKNTGAGYLVAASVKPAPADNVCGSQGDDDFCMLDACTSSGCPDVGTKLNYFEAMHAPLVDMVNLHWSSWTGDICTRGLEGLDIGKPVVIDTDGGDASTNNNQNIEKWAQNVLLSGNQSCGASKGTVHFYQTKDGALLQADPTPPPSYMPSLCKFDDSGPVDCEAWNALADGLPTRFCRTGGTPVEVTPCVSRANYCEWLNNSYPNPSNTACPQDEFP